MKINSNRARNLASRIDLENSKQLSIRVANDRSSQRKACDLLRTAYRHKGYWDGEGGENLPPSIVEPNMLTILTESETGDALGTASLESAHDPIGVGSSGAKMKKSYAIPCEAIFLEELQTLIHSGRRMGEITKLAMVTDTPHAKTILLRQFNLLYIAARHIFGLTDFVIEVNPRHVKYYEFGLGFKKIGQDRPCPRVGGAPACLLHLDLSIPAKALQDREKGLRIPRLYTHFINAADEWALARNLILAHHSDLIVQSTPKDLGRVAEYNFMGAECCSEGRPHEHV